MAAKSEADWTPRRVYRLLAELFRTWERRHCKRCDGPLSRLRNPGDPLSVPFYDTKPICRHQFEAARADFVSRAISRELHSRLPSERPMSEREGRAYELSGAIHAFVEMHCVGRVYLAAPPAQQARMQQDAERRLWADRLLFADSAKEQGLARRELRARLRGRPTPVKSLCRELLSVIPPKSRKQIGVRQEWVGNRREQRPSVQQTRAEQQFLWAFLKGEAHDGDPAEVSGDLAEAYPFLGLTATEIAAGLENPHQADEDSTRYFGRRSVRAILSRRRRATREARD